ncbi:MAG: GAF domain-containing protein [Enterobacterales bacterium]|nr:GAF domain-containing protein [Enterobacterales bacterium]
MQHAQTSYSLLAKQLTALLESQPDFVTNQSQFAALVYHSLADISWAGFYWINKDAFLSLGSFQGKIACAKIAVGEGVCGKVAQQKQGRIVADVNQFEGHIACDAGSKSELVYPIIKNEKLIRCV